MGKEGRGVSKFALVVSAVSASSWRCRGRGARARTCEATAPVAVEILEILAAREGIQRPCGSEESRYSQKCQGVQISDGLGGQTSVPRTRQSFADFVTTPVFPIAPG